MYLQIRRAYVLILTLISSACLHASLPKKKEVDKGKREYNRSLRMAVQNRNIACIKKHLEDSKNDPNEPIGTFGKSLLHEAAWEGDLKIIEFLISRPGIKLNIQDRRGVTPLMLAVMGKHVEVVSYLIDKHKEDKKDIGLNLCSDWEGTALHCASTVYEEKGRKAKIEIAKLLLDCPGIERDSVWVRKKIYWHNHLTPLHSAVLNGFKQVVELFIEVYEKKQREDIIGLNKKDNHGHTPYLAALASYENENKKVCEKNVYLEKAFLEIVKLLSPFEKNA